MKLTYFALGVIFAVNSLLCYKASAQTEDDFKFTVERAFLTKSLWLQPYRYTNDSLKPLSVKISIEKISDRKEPLDFNRIYLLDDSRKLRIRPNAIYFHRAERKIYLKSKPVNQNYNDFLETTVEGYENFEAKTYKTNFFGVKKKNLKASVQQLKKLNLKSKKVTYFVDFPVKQGFTYAKVYYDDKPIGFAAITSK